jgi:cell division protein FtsN
MSRDYKAPSPKRNGNRGGGSLLVGILIGLVLGLGIALAVAWYINKMPTPFLPHGTPPAKADMSKGAPPKAQLPTAAAPEAKPRFEFYKILPGVEEPATEQQVREAQQRPAADKDTFFLQAGAFHSAPDAERRKAQLALLGVEATIQTTVMPDKSGWHRVRVGPYTAVEEINRVRDVLKQGGVETTLIKARESSTQVAK